LEEVSGPEFHAMVEVVRDGVRSAVRSDQMGAVIDKLLDAIEDALDALGDDVPAMVGRLQGRCGSIPQRRVTIRR
jgi:hypothetical protein